MTDKQDQETLSNVEIDIKQKPQNVKVYKKEYFYSKKPLSLLSVLFVGLLLVGIYLYVFG